MRDGVRGWVGEVRGLGVAKCCSYGVCHNGQSAKDTSRAQPVSEEWWWWRWVDGGQ